MENVFQSWYLHEISKHTKKEVTYSRKAVKAFHFAIFFNEYSSNSLLNP